MHEIGDRRGEGADLVQSSVSFGLAGQYIENLTLTGSANISATGNPASPREVIAFSSTPGCAASKRSNSTPV